MLNQLVLGRKGEMNGVGRYLKSRTIIRSELRSQHSTPSLHQHILANHQLGGEGMLKWGGGCQVWWIGRTALEIQTSKIETETVFVGWTFTPPPTKKRGRLGGFKDVGHFYHDPQELMQFDKFQLGRKKHDRYYQGWWFLKDVCHVCYHPNHRRYSPGCLSGGWYGKW